MGMWRYRNIMLEHQCGSRKSTFRRTYQNIHKMDVKIKLKCHMSPLPSPYKDRRNTMLKKIVIFIMTVFLFADISYALSNKKYEEFMMRQDFRNSDNYLTKCWKDLKSNIDKNTFRNILNIQRQWVKSGRYEEVNYIKRHYSNLDEIAMYSVATLSRAQFIRSISTFLKNNPHFSDDMLEKFILSLNYYDIIDDSVNTYKNKYHDSKQDSNIMSGVIDNNELIQCSYKSYEKERSTAELANNILSFISPFVSNKWVTGANMLSGALSKIDRQEFLYKFAKDLNTYTIYEFYTGETKKFYNNRGTRKITQDDFKNGFSFSTNSIKSNLDYVAIDVRKKGNNANKKLYVYKVDKYNNSMSQVDTRHFLQNIIDNYKFEKSSF